MAEESRIPAYHHWPQDEFRIALDAVRNCKDIQECIDMCDSGIVNDCLNRIRANQRQSRKHVDMWAEEWAKNLDRGAEGAVDLNMDRKLSFLLLRTLLDQWKGEQTLTSANIVNDFGVERIMGILGPILPLKRASFLYNMKLPGYFHAPGMHWVSEIQVGRDPEWAERMKVYDGSPSINKRFHWLMEDEDLAGLGLSNNSFMREYTTPIENLPEDLASMTQGDAKPQYDIDLSGRECWKVTDSELTRVLCEQNCENIESINLASCCKLTDDSLEALTAQCRNLKSIDLRYCWRLTDKTLRAMAQNCKNLESFSVCWCEKFTDDSLVDLAEKCSQLKTIDICGGKLTDKTIQAVAKNCPNLELIKFIWCKGITVEGVEHICGYKIDSNTPLLPSLRTLDLRSCGLTSLPDKIGNLTNDLEKIDLRGNLLKKLPRSIAELPRTCQLLVEDNPLQEPPIEIAKQGLPPIARYFEELHGGATVSQQLKVVFVGGGEAGKTSLRRAMAGEKPALTGDGHDRATTYLELKSIPLHLRPTRSDPLRILIYDCGGQQVYAVGQCPFLTGLAVYLLFVGINEASDEHYDQAVFRFLVLLHARAPGATIQLILSKVDEDPSGIESKKKWLKRKVDETLEGWRTSRPRLRSRSLTILPEILAISVKNDPLAAKQKVFNLISHIAPNFPSVGQSIPDTWVLVWKLLGAFREHGPDTDEGELFEKARSANARPVSAVDETTAKAKGAYSPRNELSSMWNRFLAVSANVRASPFTFNDALNLLEAQGDVFIDSDLVFLRPTFVTDLLRPLIDHTLTTASVKKSAEVAEYVRKSGTSRKHLIDGLENLTESGELDKVVLPFLWRDLELKLSDFDPIIEMFVNAGVIFHSSLPSRRSGERRPVVLFRLQEKPIRDANEMWPNETPVSMKQRELRIQLFAGCPESLAAHFAADAHRHGDCVYAWRYGAIVVTKDGHRIRAQLGHINDEPCLIFSVRGELLGLGTRSLLHKAVNFVEKERASRLPGLLCDIVVVCPKCLCKRKDEEQTDFSWDTIFETTEKPFCRLCQDYIDFGWGTAPSSNTRLLLDDAEEDVGELSLPDVDNPTHIYPISPTLYVFLSHTGRDGVKEEIARPTYWFLTKILKVGAFLDEESTSAGTTKMEALLPPACMCTHAVLILSPTYRKRRFCVKELNTFMNRWRRRDGIHVIPALWMMDNLDGYHPDVDDLIRIGNGGTKYSVNYMVKTLWPALVNQLGHADIPRDSLEEHLVQYVESQRAGRHAIPPDLETFADRKRGRI